MKAQSAIEYLMTYGWMLLVVALVGGLLFTLFQDQELEGQTVKGFEGEDVRVDKVTASNDTVQLSITSHSTENIKHTNLCLNHDEFSNSCSENFSIARLDSQTITLDGFNQSKQTYSYNVNISYKKDNGLSDKIKGTVSLRAKPKDNLNTETQLSVPSIKSVTQ
jgi:hypothetical protein